MECLDGIIGISQSVCPCFEDDRPTDYNESASGVFLDQLEGFNPEVVKSGDDCSRGGYWERAERAIENAKMDYKNALLQCVGASYKSKIEPLHAQLGDISFSGSQNYNTTYAGIKIHSLQLKGGVIIIKKIGILINQTTAVTVKVFNNINGGTLLYTSTPIAATQDTLTWAVLSTPLEMPMYSYQGNVSYYVVMELSGSFQPKKNKKDCGCGGVLRPYLRWLDFEGVKGNAIDNMSSTGKFINGIVVDVEMKCKNSEIICSPERPLDFVDDGEAIGMAYAIRFRAAAILYNEVLSTTNINRETMMNREEMANLVARWSGEFQNWINYLCSNVNVDNNDCLTCKQNTGMVKRQIMVTRPHA